MEKVAFFISLAEEFREREEIVLLTLKFVFDPQKVLSLYAQGAVVVLADIIPEIEHHLVGEFLFGDGAFDEKLAHLLVLAFSSDKNLFVDHLEELNPLIALLANGDGKIVRLCAGVGDRLVFHHPASLKSRIHRE